MVDILLALLFAWALSWIGLDDMTLDLLNALFDKEFDIIVYYITFGLLGLANWLMYKLQGIRGRD